MKNFNYSILFLILTFVFYKCAQEPLTDNINAPENIFSDFNSFPNTPFTVIDFSQPTKTNFSALTKNNFTSLSENECIRQADSLSVILSESEDLTDFKIYLKSQFYLRNNQLLFEFLGKQARSISGTKQFAQMEYTSSKTPFYLTYFSTQNIIRIQFFKL